MTRKRRTWPARGPWLLAGTWLACAPWHDVNAMPGNDGNHMGELGVHAHTNLPRAVLRVVTFEASCGRRTFKLEVAATPTQQERGLMHRCVLAQDGGMLFVFADDQIRSFWMKDTCVALDIIFIDAAGRVVGVVAHAEPYSTRDRRVPAASRFVVEVAAGTARRLGIGAGTPTNLGR